MKKHSVSRKEFSPWVIAALENHSGTANIFQISKYVWDNYHHIISQDSKMLYTWQYELRWAIQNLKKELKIQHKEKSIRGTWELC
jgi:hypothetical protein